MGAVLSDDLHKRVVAAIEAGTSQQQAAKRFGVSHSSGKLWLRQWRQHGHLAAKAQGGDRRSQRIEAQAEFLLKQIEQTPEVTLAELQAQLRRRGLSVGIGTVWRFFRRHDISFKKRHTPTNNSFFPVLFRLPFDALPSVHATASCGSQSCATGAPSCLCKPQAPVHHRH